MDLKNKYPFYFILPALIIFLIFSITPTITGIYYSFTDWNIYAASLKFIGLDNYKEMFSDPKVITAFKNTLIFAFVVTILQNTLGLGLALMVNEVIYLKGLLRTIFFLPFIISPLIIGHLFTAIYHPSNGVLNKTLSFIGLDFMTLDWLNDPSIALISVIGTDIWRVIGFAMIIYLAGLQFVPNELSEAAAIDGASYWIRFKHIVFPLLAPSFTINILLSLISSLKVFDMILVLTGGGPGYKTEVFNTYIMRIFSSGELGYATAVNLVLFIIITGIGVPVLYFLRKREVEM